MPQKILIVDADPPLLQLLSQELGHAGYQTVAASTGPAALEAARANSKPDLVILGVNLPEMNGFEVAKRLQSQPDTANIPLIFLTTRNTAEDKLASFEAGGLDYLTKPINMPELLARVKANMRRLEAERNQARRDLELYKSNLSENMSHELLTPVSKVLNGVDLLTRLSAKQHITLFDQPIEIIRTGAEELRWLLEDLLVINQLDDGRMGPFRQPMDLAEAVRVMTDQIETKYRRRNISFILEIPESWPVNLHRKHLYHILHHLLDNAAKFSPDDSRPSVTVQPVGQAGASLTVHNQGQGIEPELQEKVFEKFYQIDMTMTRDSGGLGLGLYIARALARTYGGDVTLTSLPGLGVTYHWLIPDTPADWG